MFKTPQGSKPNPVCFGVGSIIEEGRDRFLVASMNLGYVHLLSLQDFTWVGEDIDVEDVGFLTEDECRRLVGGIPGCAFSDCTFDAKGLK